MTVTIDDIRAIIDQAVRQHFAGVDVSDVRVSEDVDHDGEAILRVDVVITRPQRLDGHTVMTLIRHLRGALAEVSEVRFPHVSFMTVQDLEDGSAAA